MPGKTLFAARLRQALEGHDRGDILRYLGVSERAMRGWLAGDRQPRSATVAAMSKALDVSADWLLGLSDDRQGAA